MLTRNSSLKVIIRIPLVVLLLTRWSQVLFFQDLFVRVSHESLLSLSQIVDPQQIVQALVILSRLSTPSPTPDPPQQSMTDKQTHINSAESAT